MAAFNPVEIAVRIQFPIFNLNNFLCIFNYGKFFMGKQHYIEINCSICKNKFILLKSYYKRRKLKGQKTFCCSKICSNKNVGIKSSQSQKGKPKAKSQGLKISENAKINPNFGMSGKKHKSESCNKISKGLTGIIKNIESIEKQRNSILGELHWNWKDGITPINEQIRHCYKYNEWRTQIFGRDNFTCQDCRIRYADNWKLYLIRILYSPLLNDTFKYFRVYVDTDQEEYVICH